MVRFQGVGLRYGAAEALRDLSFTLGEGSFHWLVGPSGAGKSSLLRLMHLALRPSRGEVEVLGQRIARLRRGALPALRRRIGVVHQDFRLLPHLSAFDNVALPLRIAGRTEAGLRADVGEILRWVGLGERAESRPASLSGGEQQRVAIARAVVIRPALLVADEPTGNLDQATGTAVMDLLFGLRARLGTTLLLITHDPALAARCGRVVRMADGQVAGDEGASAPRP